MQKEVYTKGDWCADVGMGDFAVSKLTGEGECPFLRTSGAGPCSIQIVGCATGQGALGHSQVHEVEQVLDNIGSMVAKLQDLTLESIIIAAGDSFTWPERETLMARARSEFNVADVRWPVPRARNSETLGYPYSAAIYFPTLHTVALFDDDDTRAQIPPSPSSSQIPMHRLKNQ
jgi:hypothetical protein